MTVLTDLFQTNDMIKLKRGLVHLAKSKDYKTINSLLRRHPNILAFNTRKFNEEIQRNEKHFTKRKCVMK